MSRAVCGAGFEDYRSSGEFDKNIVESFVTCPAAYAQRSGFVEPCLIDHCTFIYSYENDLRTHQGFS